MDLFTCRTPEGYHVKVLSELLSHNLKSGCFQVDRDSISLRMFDHHRHSFVNLQLLSENFPIYDFCAPEMICVGLNLNHFYRVLKSVKKNDSLELSIGPDARELSITTFPKDSTKVTTSVIKIIKFQNISDESPTGYGRPVIVDAADFQKMSRELNSIGSTNIEVHVYETFVEFVADADSILTRRVRLGEIPSNYSKLAPLYSATFSNDRFNRISKISGFGSVIQVFAGTTELPLLFKSSVGTLGKIALYIKSEELLQNELEMDTDMYCDLE